MDGSGSGPSPCKLQKLEEEKGLPSCEELDEQIFQALTDISDNVKEMDTLNATANEEIVQVEIKYNKLKKPIYAKRTSIIERIPNFWINAMINHPQTNKIIDEEEEDCMRFLTGLEVEAGDIYVDEGHLCAAKYGIKFTFGENPFFDNAELVKEFEHGDKDDPTASKSTSTTINWKDPVQFAKLQKGIITERKKRGLDIPTFFSWFSDNTCPYADDVADAIKDDLWPNPLKYYLPVKDEDDDDDYELLLEDDSEDGDENEDEEIMKLMEEEETGSVDEDVGEEEESSEDGDGDDEEDDPEMDFARRRAPTSITDMEE